MAIKHAFAYKNQVLASRKKMVSSVVSKSKGKLLTYMGIFRLNGHDSVLFHIFVICFFLSFIHFLKKCNNCTSVDLILLNF